MLRHTVLGGRTAGMRVVVGVALGCLVSATASLAGLTALLEASRLLAYDIVRIAGAAYLIWLGASAIWKTLPRNRDDTTEITEVELDDPSSARACGPGC